MAVAEEVLIDRERAEYIGGEWVEKPMGTLEHSAIARRIEAALRAGFRHIGRTEREVTVRLGDDVLIPDVVVLGRGELRPLLCVEVRSPGQRMSTLIRKCEIYRDNQVPFCWVVDLDGSAWEYHSGTRLRAATDGVLRAGEISVELGAIFLSDNDE